MVGRRVVCDVWYGDANYLRCGFKNIERVGGIDDSPAVSTGTLGGRKAFGLGTLGTYRYVTSIDRQDQRNSNTKIKSPGR